MSNKVKAIRHLDIEKQRNKEINRISFQFKEKERESFALTESLSDQSTAISKAKDVRFR